MLQSNLALGQTHLALEEGRVVVSYLVELNGHLGVDSNPNVIVHDLTEEDVRRVDV